MTRSKKGNIFCDKIFGISLTEGRYMDNNQEINIFVSPIDGGKRSANRDKNMRMMVGLLFQHFHYMLVLLIHQPLGHFFILEQPKKKKRRVNQVEKNNEDKLEETKTNNSRFILFIGTN